MKKKIFVLLTTLFLCFAFALGVALGGCATAKFLNSKGLEYTLLDDNTYEAAGIGTCMDTNIGIPRSYKGKAVTSIGENAFRYCDSLKSVTFNGTVAQWNAISKGSYWSYNVPAEKVVCSDGEVTL